MTKFLAISMLFSVLLLPDIKLSSSFAARPEDIIILLSFVYLVYRKTLFNTFFTWLMLLMFVEFFASIGLNERLLSVNSFEFYNKIIKGLVSYTIFLLFMQERKNYNFIIRFSILILSIYIVANLLQPTGKLNFILNYYIGSSQVNAMERTAAFGKLSRVTGFIGNPNNNAVFFVFMLGFTLDMIFLYHKKIFIFLLAGCLVVIMLTQSRTMFGTSLVVLVVVMMITGNFYILAFGGLFIMLVKFIDIPYLTLIFDLQKISQTNSVVNRLREWELLTEMIKQQPIIGFGGYKEYFYMTQSYPENEYILAWFRYGIFYLITFTFMLVFSAILGVVRVVQKVPGGFFMLSTNLAMLLSSISNAPFNNPRLFIFYSFVHAFYAASVLHFIDSPLPIAEKESHDEPAIVKT